jgi:phosphopantothenoylcysteine decarboxylase/phosphopantothenate--cysteine ligase
MNEGMWLHPATRANVELLQARGVSFVEVGSGDLACGTEGVGRLAELDVIVKRAESILKSNAELI